jgi:hypothetical protein
MEITNLTLFGFPVMTLLAIWGVGYMIRTGFKDWGEQRARNKELNEADRAFKAKYRWEPDMSTGSDQGKWVRKDGLPDYD